MGKKYIYERFVWLDKQIKSGKIRNRNYIAEQFEISPRQVSRDVRFLKEILNVPIVFSKEEGGYVYTDKNYELPLPRISEREIISLVIAECMAIPLPGQKLLNDIDSIVKKLSHTSGIDIEEIKKKISIKNIRCYSIAPSIYDAILKALNIGNKIEIEYQAKYRKEKTIRIVNPLHLILYMGNWYLYAFCEKRNGDRTFDLSGIKRITVLNKSIHQNLRAKNVRKIVEENYGIFFPCENEPCDEKKVKLKFSSEIADRIKEQVWLKSQQMEEMEDGSILLSFKVTNFTEVSEEILRYGCHVEVLQPSDLRDYMQKIIDKMAALY